MTDTNRKNTTDISVPDAFLPVLAHALAISRNTQMMCGASAAQKLAEELRLDVEARIPAAIRIFDDGHWCEAATATQKEDVHVGTHPHGWRHGGMSHAVIIVTDGGRCFSSTESFPEQEAIRLAGEIAQLLEDASSSMEERDCYSEEDAETQYRELLRDPSIVRNEHIRRTRYSIPGGSNALVHLFPGGLSTNMKSCGCLRVYPGKIL